MSALSSMRLYDLADIFQMELRVQDGCIAGKARRSIDLNGVLIKLPVEVVSSVDMHGCTAIIVHIVKDLYMLGLAEQAGACLVAVLDQSKLKQSLHSRFELAKPRNIEEIWHLVDKAVVKKYIAGRNKSFQECSSSGRQRSSKTSTEPSATP